MIASEPGTARGQCRIICVDDHAFVVEGLRARLSIEPDLAVVAVLSSADDLRWTLQASPADVVLLDVDMPGRDVFETIEDLKREHPEVRPVILSAHVRDSYIEAAVRAGAWGYLSKRDTPAVIIAAIRSIARGRFAFSDEVLARCGVQPGQEQRIASSTAAPTRLRSLTPRELHVLRLIGKGLARAEIAKAIHRSPKTVDAHRGAIMDKLGIHDRVELARFALREGLVEL